MTRSDIEQSDPDLAELYAKIQEIHSKAEISYNALCQMDTDSPDAEEILPEAEQILLEIEDMSRQERLAAQTEAELQATLEATQELLSILETLPSALTEPKADSQAMLKAAIQKQVYEGQLVYDAILETVEESPDPDIHAELLSTVDGVWTELKGLTSIKNIDGKPDSLLAKILSETIEMVSMLSNLSMALIEAQCADAPAVSSFVALQKARIEWDRTRKNVLGDLQTVETELMRNYAAVNADPASEVEYDLADAGAKVKGLYRILEGLDAQLLYRLDEALNAKGPARAAKSAEAKTLLGRYRQFLDGDPLLAAIDESGMLAAGIRPRVNVALQMIEGRI